MMLHDSNDPEIRSNPPEIRTARKWKAEDEVDSAISILKHRDIVGSVQTDRKGIRSVQAIRSHVLQGEKSGRQLHSESRRGRKKGSAPDAMRSAGTNDEVGGQSD